MDEGNCPAVGSSGNILDFCETALKISGPVPLVQEVGLRLPAGSLATAVTGVTLGPPGATSLVAIVGTADGDIIKVLVEGIVDSSSARSCGHNSRMGLQLSWPYGIVGRCRPEAPREEKSTWR